MESDPSLAATNLVSELSVLTSLRRLTTIMSSIHFPAITRRLIRVGERRFVSGVRLFEKELPQIATQIRSDARRYGPLAFWGRSVNHDEIVQATIVQPVIVRLLGHFAARTLSIKTPHAGLQHTYGYLLTNIKTPYGFKRERWTETEIESAFHLHPTTLGPVPDSGTLLANATVLLGTLSVLVLRLF